MKILDALRKRRSHADAPGAEASSPDEAELPFLPDYDKLDVKEVGARLPELSQVELARVETYERSHKNRPEVLDKLRYLRGSEPLPGYDALGTEQIAVALAGADAATVKAVRDYERRFGRRPQVLDEAARVLPAAQASPGEAQARDEQVARVREGFAGRDNTADGLASRRSASDD